MIEYSDNYAKTSKHLKKFYRDGQVDDKIISKPFKFKSRFTNKNDDDSTVNPKYLKYILGNSWNVDI